MPEPEDIYAALRGQVRVRIPEPEVIYAVRRADGELIGEYSFVVVSGPADWAPAEADDPDESTEYEMLRMTVAVVGRRTLPECRECQATPAPYWGLCEFHAREDDPEYFVEEDGDA